MPRGNAAWVTAGRCETSAPGAAEAEVAKRDRRQIVMRAALDRIEGDPGKI